jgi:hypothetical protein
VTAIRRQEFAARIPFRWTRPMAGFALAVGLYIAASTIRTIVEVAVLNDPALVDSGFDLTLDLDETAPRPQTVRLCLWTDDLVYGRRLVHYATQPDLCPS